MSCLFNRNNGGCLIKMKEMKIKFYGVDDWSRPVFKRLDKKEFYGCVDKLVDYDISNEEIYKQIKSTDLVYFGNSFGCEPMGTSCPKNESWIIIK